jgi:5-methylthioribose kinase
MEEHAHLRLYDPASVVDRREPELLAPETIGPYLVARGLVEPGSQLTASELGWGVSSVVIAVDADGLHAVVKQALPRLRVAEEWLAKRERAITEADALRLAAAITPNSVPDVLDVDEDTCALVVARAPAEWPNWKEELLAGRADSGVARRLGELLAHWHERTEGDEDVARRFSDAEAFEQLRVDPYYRTVMRRWPALERAVGAHVEAMLDTHACLVHGDFSPKNVLVGEDGMWVIDFEVAHVGDPVFDLAFMVNHLMLKAIHRPEGRDGYRGCAEAFLAAYGREAEPSYLFGHVGCLMVARVDGKSPAEYLTEGERLQARALGTRLVLDPPKEPDDAWRRLEETVR